MDRKDGIYRKTLHKQDLAGLAELCVNVANNRSGNPTQVDAAHALRVEWVRLDLNGSPHKKEAETSLKKRMVEFLVGVPAWMLSGL